jgi:hypothetical protein
MLSERSTDSKFGTMHDYYIVGMVAYGALIIMANVKMFILSKTFSVLSVFFIVGSWLLYPIFYWVYNKYEAFDIYGNYDM